MGRPATIDMAVTHYRDAAATVGPRYSDGVRNADWFTPAASDAAEQNFTTAMQRVISNRSHQQGIQRSSNALWQNAALTKGAPIIGTRMQAGADKYRTVWGPMYTQILNTVSSLPPRTTSAEVNVQNRLLPVVRAWQQAAGTA